MSFYFMSITNIYSSLVVHCSDQSLVIEAPNPCVGYFNRTIKAIYKETEFEKKKNMICRRQLHKNESPQNLDKISPV